MGARCVHVFTVWAAPGGENPTATEHASAPTAISALLCSAREPIPNPQRHVITVRKVWAAVGGRAWVVLPIFGPAATYLRQGWESGDCDIEDIDAAGPRALPAARL
jgi:hypothetical protein